MLCPPIDNFNEPDSVFHVEKIKGSVPVDSKYITNFHFSHFISVVVPDVLTIPENLVKHFTSNTDYYKVSNFDLSALINVVFLNCFINNGKLSLLSVNTRVDCDNSIAITTNCELILHLHKDTYQSLGLDGKLSHFEAKLKNHFVVKVNLNDVELRNNPIKLTKLKNKLKILDKFTAVLFWEPSDDEICPSSIAKYIFDLGYDIKLCNTDFRSNTAYTVKVPLINLENIVTEDVLEFMEWLGMLIVGCDLEKDDLNDYVNSYVTPSPNVEVGQVKCLQWRGFFTVNQIQELIKTFVDYNIQYGKPWVSMYVQGFSDSPITWANEEQNFFASGDNSYTVMFNKNNCLFCTYKTSRKRYK